MLIKFLAPRRLKDALEELAACMLHRNPQGLLNEITFNTRHYIEADGNKMWRFGSWVQLETLLHEQVHLWQQDFGGNPVRPGRVYHNQEFVEKCESLGLHPMPLVGYLLTVADGVFAQLMAELGIDRPPDVPREQRDKSVRHDWFRPNQGRGTSTLHKWIRPGCGLSVRIGIRRDPRLVHDACSEDKGEKVSYWA